MIRLCFWLKYFRLFSKHLRGLQLTYLIFKRILLLFSIHTLQFKCRDELNGLRSDNVQRHLKIDDRLLCHYYINFGIVLHNFLTQRSLLFLFRDTLNNFLTLNWNLWRHYLYWLIAIINSVSAADWLLAILNLSKRFPFARPRLGWCRFDLFRILNLSEGDIFGDREAAQLLVYFFKLDTDCIVVLKTGSQWFLLFLLLRKLLIPIFRYEDVFWAGYC